MKTPLMSASELGKKELKKHISAIRVSQNVGLLGRKIWNVLLLNAYENLLENKTHSIPVRVLSEVIGYDSKSYKSLDKALERLQTTLVTWDLGGGKKVDGMWLDNFKRSQMMGGISISDGVIDYRFDSDLAKILYNPQIYQRISIAQQKLFKSSHSLALWENCLRYVKVGSTGMSDLDEWREILGATSKSYNQFKEFKRAVLNPSLKEVSELSNIEVFLQTEKRGRKITKIGFLIKEKSQRSLFDNDPELVKEKAEYEDLIKIGIHKVQALKLLEEFSTPYIREKINLLKETQAKKQLENPVGWLRAAIENDYVDASTVAKEAERKRQQKQEEKERKAAAAKALESKKIDLAKTFLSKKSKEFILTMSDQEQSDFLEKLRAENPMMTNIIQSITDTFVIAQLVKIIPNYEEEKEKYIRENL